MKVGHALSQGGFVAAACVACCAPPIVAALGVTAGVAATAGIFLGLAAAVAVVLVGGAWTLARARRHGGPRTCQPAGLRVHVAAPTRGDLPGSVHSARGRVGSRRR